MSKPCRLALVGATGAMGEILLEQLATQTVPVTTLYPLASTDSSGDTIEWQGKSLRVSAVDDFDFSQADIVVFAASERVVQRHAARAQASGCMVLDLSGGLPGADLVMLNSEIKAASLTVAEPLAHMLARVLPCLEEEWGVSAVHVAALYPAASRGRDAVEELAQQTVALFNNQDVELASFPVRSAFNAIPQVGPFVDSHHTRTEQRVMSQLPALLARDDLLVSMTAVQAPVFYGLSAAVTVELDHEASEEAVRTRLDTESPALLRDEAKAGGYMTPIDVIGKADVFVSRLRQIAPDRVSFWLCADPMCLNATAVVQCVAKWVQG